MSLRLHAIAFDMFIFLQENRNPLDFCTDHSDAARSGASHAFSMVRVMALPQIHLTRSEIEDVLQHAHWIAAKNGAQSRFVREKYPSYSFGGLMKALLDSGCLAASRTRGSELGHFSGYRVRANVNGVDIPTVE